MLGSYLDLFRYSSTTIISINTRHVVNDSNTSLYASNIALQEYDTSKIITLACEH